jgi:hypothetical protein
MVDRRSRVESEGRENGCRSEMKIAFLIPENVG